MSITNSTRHAIGFLTLGSYDIQMIVHLRRSNFLGTQNNTTMCRDVSYQEAREAGSGSFDKREESRALISVVDSIATYVRST